VTLPENQIKNKFHTVDLSVIFKNVFLKFVNKQHMLMTAIFHFVVS